MEFEFTPEEEAFKQEVHSFFLSEKKIVDGMREEQKIYNFGPNTWDILKKLGSRGWLCPTWPKKYGGLELPDIYRYIVMEELNYYTGCVGLTGAGMVGPVLLHRGSEQQKNEYLPQIARGETEFCLGYTEPEAGSDFANVSLRAEDRGEHFFLNGQKMFNTSAHFARYHWLAARTEVTKPKHRGISLFIVDLQTPGITIRPLITMAGERTNEVFYDNVRVPREALVGEKNRGFYYVMEALDFERVYFVSHLIREFQDLVDYVKKSGRSGEVGIRQKLGETAIDVEIARLFALRIVSMISHGKPPSFEAQMMKVIYAETENRLVNTAMQFFGQYGQLKEGARWAPLNGEFEFEYRAAVRNLITRGTVEIMKNIIAQRGLGLPRE